MPAYNAQAYLEAAIRSIVEQSFQDLELVVVDDGSTDATAELAAAHAAADARVRLLRQPNSGRPGYARNAGIEVAAGEYICFLDADDFYLPGRLAAMVDGLDRHPGWVAAFHDLTYVDERGADTGERYLGGTGFMQRAGAHLVPLGDHWFECTPRFFVFQSLQYAALHTQSVMIARHRTPPGTIRFDERFVICEDTDMWIRLGMAGRIGYYDRVLSGYRVHGSSITKNQLRFSRDSAKLHMLNFERISPQLTQDEREQYRAKVARCLDGQAYVELTQGLLADARRTYRLALNWGMNGKRIGNYARSLLPRRVRAFLKRARAVV